MSRILYGGSRPLPRIQYEGGKVLETFFRCSRGQNIIRSQSLNPGHREGEADMSTWILKVLRCVLQYGTSWTLLVVRRSDGPTAQWRGIKHLELEGGHKQEIQQVAVWERITNDVRTDNDSGSLVAKRRLSFVCQRFVSRKVTMVIQAYCHFSLLNVLVRKGYGDGSSR